MSKHTHVWEQHFVPDTEFTSEDIWDECACGMVRVWNEGDGRWMYSQPEGGRRMSDELKPCRRCGGSDDDLLISPEHDENENYVIGYWVICECGLSVHAYGDQSEAIRKWNEWPAEDALRAEVLRLNAQYYEMETYGCPYCNGDGEINGNTCFACNGHGVLYVKPMEAAE